MKRQLDEEWGAQSKKRKKQIRGKKKQKNKKTGAQKQRKCV